MEDLRYQTIGLDLVGRFVICCKICLIWDLAGFYFWVPKWYANLILACDLVEIVLIGWHSSQFRMLQDFTSWCKGCTGALWHIVLYSTAGNITFVSLYIDIYSLPLELFRALAVKV